MRIHGWPLLLFGFALLGSGLRAAPAQYQPGDLIISGLYSTTANHTDVLGMKPNGQVSTVARLPGIVREIVPSPDNRSLWASTAWSGLTSSAIRRIAPDGSHSVVLGGDYWPILGVDGSGDAIVWDLNRPYPILRISPGLVVTTIRLTPGNTATGSLDLATGDALGAYGSLVRIGLGSSNTPITTIVASSRFTYCHTGHPGSNGVVAVDGHLDLLHVALTSPARITTILGAIGSTHQIRRLNLDLSSGLVFATFGGGVVAIFDPVGGAVTRWIPVPGGADGVTFAHSRHLCGGTVPRRGQRYLMLVSSPGEPGASYIVALSLGLTPGQKLPDGRRLLLNPDALFFWSLSNTGIFSNMQGRLDPRGEAVASVAIPNLAPLSGTRFFAACITITAGRVGVVSTPVGATIR